MTSVRISVDSHLGNLVVEKDGLNFQNREGEVANILDLLAQLAARVERAYEEERPVGR